MKTIDALLLLLLCLSLFSCSDTPGSRSQNLLVDSSFINRLFADTPLLVVGSDTPVSLTPILLANGGYTTGDKSYIKERAGEIKLVHERQIRLLLSRLQSGEYQVVILPLFDYMKHRDTIADASPVIFYLSGWSQGIHSLRSYNTSFSSLDDISGRSILTIQDSSAHHLVQLFMQQRNLPPDSINWKFADSHKSLTKLAKSNEFDAIARSGIPGKKHPPVISSRQASRFVPYVAVTTRTHLLSLSARITLFINGSLYGNMMLSSHPDKARSILETSHFSDEEIALTMQNFLPSSYAENLAFFRMTETYKPDIYQLLYYTVLAPEKSEVRPNRALHSLFDTSHLNTADIDALFLTLPRPDVNNGKSQEQLHLFSLFVPVHESRSISSAAQIRALKRAGTLHALMPSASLEFSFLPSEDSRYTYSTRSIVEQAVRYVGREDLFSRTPSIDSQTLKDIEKRRYDGPYGSEDYIVIRFTGHR